MSAPSPPPGGGPPSTTTTGPPVAAAPPDDSVRSLLALARPLALVFAGLAALLFLVFLALSFVEAVLGRGPGDLVAVAYCAVSAAVNFLIWREVPDLQRLEVEGRYGALREPVLIWAILGLLFFVVAGVVLLLAWVKIDLKAGPSPTK